MSKFKFNETDVPGIVLIEPTVFGDSRGYFMETYQQDEFAKGGIPDVFIQDNQSSSHKGVLRGLHFQKEHTQGKLVRVVSGKVFDIGVDLRPNSPYFGKWAGAVLSADNKRMLYVPQGFGHGFVVLSDSAEFTYKCTDVYDPSSEGGVRWNDPDINVAWPDLDVAFSLSDKDNLLPSLEDQDFSFFERWYKP